MKYRWILAALLALTGCGNDSPTDTGAPDIATEMGSDAAVSDMAAVDLPSATSFDDPPPGGELLIEREVDFVEGEADLVAFEVPDDAVSVMVTISGNDQTYYTVGGWRNGDGADLVPFDWFENSPPSPGIGSISKLCYACPLRVTAAKGAFGAIAPNNESTAVVPGEHSIRPFAYKTVGFITNPVNDETAMVRVVVKRAPAPPTTGVLDINIYLTGAQGWTAATAPTDANVQHILAGVEEIYEHAGITIGAITYTDIPAEYAVIENVVYGPELMRLFSQSVDQPRPALNLFLCDELFAAGAGTNSLGILLGVAGGVPGPAVSGSFQSGVAINTTGDPRFDVPTSRVIAHEMGHFLGLFHTSENGGTAHDPIADTAVNDDTLIMYWNSGASLDPRHRSPRRFELLTPTQGLVMRGNPWVRTEGSL